MSFFEKIFKKDHISSSPVNKMSNAEFVKAFPDYERLLKSYIDFKKCIADELEDLIKSMEMVSHSKESLMKRFDELSPVQQDIEVKELELRVIIVLNKSKALHAFADNVLTRICPVAHEMCKDILNDH